MAVKMGYDKELDQNRINQILAVKHNIINKSEELLANLEDLDIKEQLSSYFLEMINGAMHNLDEHLSSMDDVNPYYIRDNILTNILSSIDNVLAQFDQIKALVNDVNTAPVQKTNKLLAINNRIKVQFVNIHQYVEQIQIKSSREITKEIFENNVSLVDQLKQDSEKTKDAIDKNLKESKKFLKGITQQKVSAENMQKQMMEILEDVSSQGQCNHHTKMAKQFEKEANNLFYIICGYFLLAVVSYSLIVFNILANYEIDKLIFNLIPITLVLLSPLIYLSYVEKRARARSFKYRDLQVSMKTLPGYLKDLGDDHLAREVKLDLSHKYFGDIYEEGKISEKDISDIALKVLDKASIG
jgi:hypothetical protein